MVDTTVGFRGFPTLLTAMVCAAWVGLMMPRLLAGIEVVSHPAGYLALVLFGPAFLLMRTALRAPRSGRGVIGAALMVGCALVATSWSTEESVTPTLLTVTAATVGFALDRTIVIAVLLTQIAVLISLVTRGVMEAHWLVVISAMMGFAASVVEVTVREFYGRQRLAEAGVALEAANASLRQAQARLEAETRAAERLRISRDLHDSVGHRLTALVLKLEVAAHLAGAQAEPLVEESRDIAKQTLSDIRAVVSHLREARPDLAESIEVLAATSSLPDVQVHVDPQAAQFPAEYREVAFRVAQEGLTNAARHAGATYARVSVECREPDLHVRVSDNGSFASDLRPGNGLTGMRERVELLGGRLQWGAGEHGGLFVEAVLPCPRRRAEVPRG